MEVEEEKGDEAGMPTVGSIAGESVGGDAPPAGESVSLLDPLHGPAEVHLLHRRAHLVDRLAREVDHLVHLRAAEGEL